MTTPSTDSATEPKTTLLTIDGMTCGGCVRHVQQALAALDGVQGAEVDFPRKQALVVHEPTVAVGDLLRAVGDAGYHASELTP
ncbi:MAG: heavy-metal-associated domain-containing protein [Planctomycetes bacterium]|nr:heavy-metal-associated domain-containing protein [Planctomycetota bacterium]